MLQLKSADIRLNICTLEAIDSSKSLFLHHIIIDAIIGFFGGDAEFV